MSSGMMASTGVVAGDDVAMAADGTTSGDSTAPLPQSVAYVPVVKPGSGFPALQDGTTGTAPATAADQVSTPQAAPAAASDAQAQSAAAATAEVVPLPAANPKAAVTSARLVIPRSPPPR